MHKPVLSNFFTIFQTYDDFLFLEATWAHGKVKIKSNLSATFILCAQRNVDFGFDVLFVKFNLEKCRIVVKGFTDIYSKQISDLFSVLKYKDAKFKHDTASCLGRRIIERNTDWIDLVLVFLNLLAKNFETEMQGLVQAKMYSLLLDVLLFKHIIKSFCLIYTVEAWIFVDIDEDLRFWKVSQNIEGKIVPNNAR